MKKPNAKPKAPQEKPPKKPREKSKTRLWEKERRDRLNDYFNKLWESLPIYDKSKPMSKPDILIHAASTIKELDRQLKYLLVDSDNGKPEDKPPKDKLRVSADLIKKLQERVKKLLLRNEQLTNLLQASGIRIPSECGAVKKSKGPQKCARQTKLSNKGPEKENRNTKEPKAKLKQGKRRRKSVPRKLIKNCLLMVSQGALQNNSCLILSKPTQTVLNPILVRNKTAPTLLVTNMIPQLSTLIVVSSNNQKPAQTSGSNGFPPLRPRLNNTSTTQSTKVPIPSLCSGFGKSPKKGGEAKKVKATKSKSEKRDNVASGKAAETVSEESESKRGEEASANLAKSDDRKEKKELLKENNNNNNKTSEFNLTPGEVQEPSKTVCKSKPSEPDKPHFELHNLIDTELSNDIFASFQVPPGCQNPESTSPTAAFLMTFPLVSSSGAKVTEVTGEDNSQTGAAPHLLHMGNMDLKTSGGNNNNNNSNAPTYGEGLLNFDGFFGNCAKQQKMPTKVGGGGGGYDHHHHQHQHQHQHQQHQQQQQQQQQHQHQQPHGRVVNQPEFSLKPDGTYYNNNNKLTMTGTTTTTATTTTTTTITATTESGIFSNYNQFKYYPPVYTSANSFFSNSFTDNATFGNNANYEPFSNSCSLTKTKSKPQSKPVNWMTTPTTNNNNVNNNNNNYYKPDYFLPANYYEPFQDYRKPEENRFSWSPTGAHPLPTLVGDLALEQQKPKASKKPFNDLNQPNFLSVSQLVDETNAVSRKPRSHRANSGNTAKAKISRHNRTNYSAEALIGGGNKAAGSYFPPIEFQQQQQQQENAALPNFAAPFQNGGNYNNYMTNQDFMGDTNNGGKYFKGKETSACGRKTRKRGLNDANNCLPPFDIHSFLSMPGPVNSPDDFQTTYLPPTTLYSCKNPLYSTKPSDPVLNSSLLPSVNGTNGTSLTNFNLSAIFPEINKGQDGGFPNKWHPV